MKKTMVLAVGVLLYTSFAWVASVKAADEAKSISGIIVDNTCAQGHRDQLKEFVATHTKDCALMPGCKASGYSLFTPKGELLALTKDSNDKVVKFLEKKGGTLKVEVKAKKIGKELRLLTIKSA